MKISVCIGSRSFEVEIDDLQARPIIATVDGQAFQVWPEGAQPGANGNRPPPPSAPKAAASVPTIHDGVPKAATSFPARHDAAPVERLVRAPLPGIVVSVAVQPGTLVERGQELCVLEAMKMKNAIRAPHAGRIATIHVVPGQAVQQRDRIFEYESG
jgi:glutaconyl-CoA/methylmalonyl-CoA decarboxylase subunit gamma